MKKSSRILIGAILCLGLITTEAGAQEAVKALLKKCESMESIDINIIRSRDKETGEIKSSMTSLTIKSNPALVKEFQDAFQADYQNFQKGKEVADNEMITRRGGKIVNLMIKYGDVPYHFNVGQADGDATVSVMEGNRRGGRIKDGAARINDNINDLYNGGMTMFYAPGIWDGIGLSELAFDMLPMHFNFDIAPLDWNLDVQIPEFDFQYEF